jgi:2-polyprenyl-3-methyl-5-hydroxy-6-metoxy-1,4-benzoquinol methylase
VTGAPDYAFPRSSASESRRLQLFEDRLDPLTKQRMEHLGIAAGTGCLEIGGGRGSIARWLSEKVGPTGRVTVTDLQLDFLTVIDAPNVELLRHDIRTDTFPQQSFDVIHARAVLMHISPGLDLLQRMVGWLTPGGWLVLEEPDFGMWAGDADPIWSSHPQAIHKSFPNLSLSQGRTLLRQIHQLGLVDVAADAEIDIIRPGTSLAEFYRLSMVALQPAIVQANAVTAEQAAALVDRPTQAHFISCGFVHIGVWGRRPGGP